MPVKVNKPLTLGYMPWGNDSRIYPFDEIFERSQNVATQGLTNCDALLLWGGEDIDAKYYGEPNSVYSDAVVENPRDKKEWQAMKLAKAMGIPIIGVCRGAQFLCAFAGGKIVQDIQNHTGCKHAIECVNPKRGNSIFVIDGNSYHHQMMYPFEIPHELLGICATSRSLKYYGGNYEYTDIPCEPEVVYFPTVKGLGIQGHPEWMPATSAYVKWCLELVKDYLLTEELETTE